MIRASMIGLLALSLVALGSLAAQQPADKDEPPPVLLKKKKADDKKPADKSDDKKLDEKKSDDKKPATKPGEKGEPKDEPEGGDPEAKAKELLARIAKDIESAKDRLKEKDTGDGTQQVQRDIVKGLDDLMEAMKNPPPQQQNQQSNPGAGESKQGQGQSQSRSQSRQQRSARSQQRGQPQGGNPMAKNGQGEPQGGQPKAGQTGQGGNKPGAGGTSPETLDKLADKYKEIWGEYPFRDRQEMDAYQKEGYMAKYRELLKQYYSIIAEKGRRPAEADR